jgi:MFS family permease
MLGCAFAAGLWTMLAANFLFALAIGMLMPYFPYLIATRAGEAARNRALGLMTTAIFTGIFVNPPLIALLRTAFSLSAIYYALGAMLAMIAAAMALPAVLGPRSRPFTTSLKTKGEIC